MKANGLVGWTLQSPLYRLLGNTMLITVTGRRTGEPITTPVSHARDGSTLRIISSHSRKWWRNIFQTPQVRLRSNGPRARCSCRAELRNHLMA